MSKIKDEIVLGAIVRCIDGEFLDDLISYCIDKRLGDIIFLIEEKQRRNLDEEI